MKIKILKYVLVGLSLVAALLAWQSVDRAINVAESSTWGVPILFFSLLFVLLYLSIMLIRRMLILQMLFLGVFLLNFIFAFSLNHVVIMLLAYLFSLWSLLKIKRDLHLNVRVSVWKSIRTGSFWMLLAFALMISSQYYCEIRNMSSANIIPRFDVGEMTGGMTSRVLSLVNQDFKNLDQEGLTIDELILQMQKNQSENQAAESNADITRQIDQMIEDLDPDLTVAQKKVLRADALQKVSGTSNEMNKEQEQLIVREGRKRFSEAAGIALTGQEKAADVLSSIANSMINKYFVSGLPDSQESSPLPFIMAFGLFLAVLSLGSIFSTAWIIILECIIWIFIKSQLISIAKVPVEMEVIEQE